jgi:hypothetical protein
MPEKAVKNMTKGEIGYPDISTKAPNGSKYYENVGKVTKQGFPNSARTKGTRADRGYNRISGGLCPNRLPAYTDT